MGEDGLPLMWWAIILGLCATFVVFLVVSLLGAPAPSTNSDSRVPAQQTQEDAPPCRFDYGYGYDMSGTYGYNYGFHCP